MPCLNVFTFIRKAFWPRIAGHAVNIRFRFGEAIQGPVNRLSIVDAKHRITNYCTRPRLAPPTSQQLMDGDEIAEALRHFLAFDLKEAIVHPHIGHALRVEGAAGL